MFIIFDWFFFSKKTHLFIFHVCLDWNINKTLKKKNWLRFASFSCLIDYNGNILFKYNFTYTQTQLPRMIANSSVLLFLSPPPLTVTLSLTHLSTDNCVRKKQFTAALKIRSKLFLILLFILLWCSMLRREFYRLAKL